MTAAADLPDPTWSMLARRGLPVVAVEGVVPILVFYGAWRAGGLAAGIVAATVVSSAVVWWQLRRGHEATIAKLTLVFLVVQAAVGLVSGSATVYLAQPVVLSAGWGIAYLASAAVRRPLIALFVQAWYPFPAWFRASAPYRREFAMQSAVWGLFFLARAAIRLWVLLDSGVGGFVVASLLTGLAPLGVLTAWSVWHARRTFSRLDLEGEHPFV